MAGDKKRDGTIRPVFYPAFQERETMERSLKDPLTALEGIGPKRQQLFQKLGVENIGQLLRLYPRRYLDFSGVKLFSQWQNGEPAVIEGVVLKKM